MQTTFKNVTVRKTTKGAFIAQGNGDVSSPQLSPAEAVRQLRLGLVNAHLDALIAHFERYFKLRANRLSAQANDLQSTDPIESLELFHHARVLRNKAAALKRGIRSTFSS